MKILLFLFPFILVGCVSKPNEKEKIENQFRIVDTLYSAHFQDSPNYRVQRFWFEVTDTALRPLPWKIGTTREYMVKVLEFEKYKTYVEGNEGIKISLVDSANHLYNFTPLDTSFEFSVYQDYPDSSLVVKFIEENGSVGYLWRKGKTYVGRFGTEDYDFKLVK